jgi:hypothetical protein
MAPLLCLIWATSFMTREAEGSQAILRRLVGIDRQISRVQGTPSDLGNLANSWKG